MPRLRDVRTGVVVSVDDDTASTLGAAYVPAVEHEKKSSVSKPSSSKSKKK